MSGADDHLAKVWDYQTKACVQTLEGHAHNVSSVCFHPELPIIVTGSEDGTVRLWHSTTYRLENTLNYGLERLWAVGYCRGSNRSVACCCWGVKLCAGVSRLQAACSEAGGSVAAAQCSSQGVLLAGITSSVCISM